MNSTTFTNPKTNETIESALTFSQVVEALKEIGTSFALDLASAFCNPSHLSLGREFWGHKLALKHLNKENNKPAPQSQGAVFSQYSRILEMFQVAKDSGLKTPKIRIAAGNERGVLSLAPEKGRNPNHIYFKNENKVYLGKISPEGIFTKSRECTVQMEQVLKELSLNPAKIASDYGHQTGNCSFCNRELTKEDSLNVGRGEWCSRRYNLPYGEERKELKEMKQEAGEEMKKVAIEFY